ncbi:uncharacterized protein [Drosophila takahashii]|uniref:uncharacterized protein n=1 Tax=Drosophila takahashii TaxID=29030 RepID=UPI003899467D
MFSLLSFKYHLCRLGNSYDVIADACRDRTQFFSFLDSRPWRSFRRSLDNYLLCDISTYPIYYWFVLIFSLYGAMHHLIRFIRLFFTKKVVSKSMWKVHGLHPKVAKRLSILNAFILTNVWGSLFYAAFYVSPSHMVPWLWIHLAIFAWKLVTVILLLWHTKGHRTRATIYLSVYVLTIWLVYQSKWAFATALKQETPEKLMLCSPFIQPLLKYAQ